MLSDTAPFFRLARLLPITPVVLAFACGTTTPLAPIGTGRLPSAARPEGPAVAERWVRQEIQIEAGTLKKTVTRAALGAFLLSQEAPPLGVRPFFRPTSANAPPNRVRFNATLAADFVRGLAAEVRRPFQPGRLDFEARIAVSHQVGLALNEDAATAALEAGLASGAPTIHLPVEEVVSPEGYVPLGLSFDVVLAEQTTRFSRYGTHRNRGRNVVQAARALDGAILPAGGTFSFNARVGERTRGRGYRPAPVIVRGELTDGMGGGVCQVSSTLYAAAFFSGLSFPTYTAHSRPSSYIGAGLDATVAFPDIDLVIENPLDFPLYVQAEVHEGELTVRIFGAAKPREVTLARRFGHWRSFDEDVREAEDLAIGVTEVAQEGIRGRSVFRTRTLTEGGRTWVEEDEVVYHPVDRIVYVGTNNSFDLLFSDAR